MALKKQENTKGTGASEENTMSQESSFHEQGYRKAVHLLRRLCTGHGFLASLEKRDNYKRIWARDGAILILAVLLTDDKDLIECAGKTLATLVAAQGPHGEIPSNVDPVSDRISYILPAETGSNFFRLFIP